MITLGLDEARRAEKRDVTYAEWQNAGFVGGPTIAGPTVSPSRANSLSAYWNGVCVIAGDIGDLDRHLFRRVGEDDRERATTHPAYKLVHDQPNAQMTAMQFWETITSHAVSWGNGFAEIEFDNALRPIGLWIITPDQIEPKVETFEDRRGRISTRRYYLYRGRKRMEYEDIFHIPGLGFDGVRGYSPVWLARQSLGLTMAAEQFGAALFGNGAHAGVVLQHPKSLSQAAKDRLRESFDNQHRGVERAHGTLVLEEGMTVSKPITIPPDDAQFLETRGFQIEEVARWLNLPPHKLKHKVNERPGGNFEASELDYQVTTLLPWTTRIEQECDRKLIPASQRGTYYTEHNYAKRLKTDTATRMSTYKTLVDLGAMDAEQVARKENLPKPKEKPTPEPPVPAPEPTPAPAPELPAPEPQAVRAEQIAGAARTALGAVIRRYGRREAENASRAVKKGPLEFGRWVERYYDHDEKTVLRESLGPVLALCAVSLGSTVDVLAVAQGFVDGYVARSRDELWVAMRAKDMNGEVAAVLKRWESARTVDGVEELMAALAAAEGNENAA